MAGHNKWSKIKHRKKIVDRRRSKAWTMCSRAIISAARQAGPDPNFNFLLRAAMEEARYHNVPNENVERAIKKGAGGSDTDSYEPVRYEGYGPAGVAVIVEAFTNNRTRTACDLRLIFSDHQGKLGITGCVGHMFAHKGRLLISGKASDEARLIDVALEAGADDLSFEPAREDEPGGPGLWTVYTPPEQMQAVRTGLVAGGWIMATAEVLKHHAGGRLEGEPAAGFDMLALTSVELSGNAAMADLLVELVDALEDNEDVKTVYINAG